jgi:hypothetical protein
MWAYVRTAASRPTPRRLRRGDRAGSQGHGGTTTYVRSMHRLSYRYVLAIGRTVSIGGIQVPRERGVKPVSL